MNATRFKCNVQTYFTRACFTHDILEFKKKRKEEEKKETIIVTVQKKRDKINKTRILMNGKKHFKSNVATNLDVDRFY